jgi:REP element-mobilizing transposase RayT
MRGRLFSDNLPLLGLGHYQAHAWVIMPNHVHLLVTPLVSGSKLLGSLTAATGRRANMLLKRTGHPFWQDESYDRLVRSGEEFRMSRRQSRGMRVLQRRAA